MAGFVQVTRSVTESEWLYNNPRACQVYLAILLRCNIAPAAFSGMQVNRGQTIISIRNLAKELHLTVSQLRTVLKTLSESGTIRLSIVQNHGGVNGKHTLVTVLEYDVITSEPSQSRPRQAQSREVAGPETEDPTLTLLSDYRGSFYTDDEHNEITDEFKAYLKNHFGYNGKFIDDNGAICDDFKANERAYKAYMYWVKNQ